MKGSKADIKAYLMDNFPGAKPGFVNVIVDALELHEKKNSDYNGKDPIFAEEADLGEKFYDIKRKYGRLHNIMRGALIRVDDERLWDTSIDLGIYAFLFTDYALQVKKNRDESPLGFIGSEKDTSRRNWSKEDDDYIVANITKPRKDISTGLGRSYRAVNGRITHLRKKGIVK